MPSDRTTEDSTEHEALWEMIPWYVNGSLSRPEIEQVEAHMHVSAAFATEIERQSALAAGVVELEAPAATDAAARSWAKLQDQILAEQSARAPQRQGQSWWAAVLSGSPGGIALAGIAAIALLVGVFAVGPGLQTQDDGFVTLTSAAQGDQPTIKFQSVDGTDPDTLVRVLAEHGMLLIQQPSSANVYHAIVPEGMDLKAAADRLMTDPAIAFAAPE